MRCTLPTLTPMAAVVQQHLGQDPMRCMSVKDAAESRAMAQRVDQGDERR